VERQISPGWRGRVAVPYAASIAGHPPYLKRFPLRRGGAVGGWEQRCRACSASGSRFPGSVDLTPSRLEASPDLPCKSLRNSAVKAFGAP
jgi:hypothetical protein